MLLSPYQAVSTQHLITLIMKSHQLCGVLAAGYSVDYKPHRILIIAHHSQVSVSVCKCKSV